MMEGWVLRYLSFICYDALRLVIRVCLYQRCRTIRLVMRMTKTPPFATQRIIVPHRNASFTLPALLSGL